MGCVGCVHGCSAHECVVSMHQEPKNTYGRDQGSNQGQVKGKKLGERGWNIFITFFIRSIKEMTAVSSIAY